MTALARAERGTTGEIRVHLSRRWLDRDPLQRAAKLFAAYRMTRTADRNAVLIYVNLRLRRFAIVGDSGVTEKLGAAYWDELARGLVEDLQSTHYENAIAIAVRTIGASLGRYFPAREAGE